MHPRNKHKGKYNFKVLIEAYEGLKPFVITNKHGNESIDFFNPKAVKALNKGILNSDYNILNWEIPPNYLCPPIPGRADYIHHVADLLIDKEGNIPKGAKVKCLDIGVGSSCIYPIIAHIDYGWTCIGSDIDKTALLSAQNIVKFNLNLRDKITIRHQLNSDKVLKGVIKNQEQIDVVVCNPPFHSSAKEAITAASKKASNLQHKKVKDPILNFGGQSNELWCEGGEYSFVRKLIFESKNFSNQVRWFTALISKKETLRHMYKALDEVNAKHVKTIEMSQGNKISRIIAWSYN